MGSPLGERGQSSLEEDRIRIRLGMGVGLGRIKGGGKQEDKFIKFVHNVCILSCFSCVRLFATLWTVAHEAPPSMGFSRQEYWSGLPFPSAGDLPDPGIEPVSPALEADASNL